MKRLIFLFVFMSVLADLFAQFDNYKLSNYEPIGRNLMTNRDIMAYKHTFGDKIYRTLFDTINNTALVYVPVGKESALRQWRDICVSCFDLDTQKVKWSKTLNPNRQKIQKAGRNLLMYNGNRLYILDSQTGEEKIDVGRKVQVAMYHSMEDWCICYNIRRGEKRIKAKDFRCFDMNTGEVLWHRDLDLTYETEVSFNLDDSIFLFVGNGIHSVNKTDGTGWDLAMKTHRFYYHPIGVFSEIVDIANVHSRILRDSTSLLMAGAEQIVKFDLQGNVIWSTDLPSEKTSHSLVCCDDERVLLVNQGYTTTDYGLVTYGRPFIAAFDWNTGNMLYLHERQMYADYAFDAQNNKEALFVLFADKKGHYSIEKYQIASGSLLAKVEFAPTNSTASGDMIEFLQYSYYMNVDSTLLTLHDADSLGVFVACENGVLHYDEKLSKSELIPYRDLYYFIRQYGDLRYFRHEGQIVVVDESDQEVANLKSDNVYFTESDIYSIKDNYLYVINPEQLKYDKEIKTKTDFPESSAIPSEEYDEEKVKSNPIEQ